MELETLLPYLFIAIALSLSFLAKNEKQYKNLDNDTKLKLIESSFYSKKIYYTGTLFILAFLYIVRLFKWFNIDFPFIILILSLAAFAQFLRNKQMKQLGLPETFTKNFKLRVIILCIAIILAVICYLLTCWGFSPKANE